MNSSFILIIIKIVFFLIRIYSFVINIVSFYFMPSILIIFFSSLDSIAVSVYITKNSKNKKINKKTKNRTKLLIIFNFILFILNSY